jgi:oligopeptide transport system substrate-binding protein
MKRQRIICIFLSLILLCSLLLAGCQPVQQVSPSPTLGGTLNLYNIDPYTLDPAVVSELASGQYIMEIFSGLLRLDENMEPAPDIAERWQVSNDGKTYTFYLRRDVKFQDGRQLTAADFKYSWERTCYPETRSMTAATYLGDIVGVKEVLAGKTREISGISLIDDYTLQVTIDAPKSYFLSKLTYPTTFVVDRANVARGGEWWRTPNGTGPFRLTQWQESTLLVLERNELYYGELAKVDSVAFQLWSGVPMDLYETGEIDVTGVSIDYIEKVTDQAGPFYTNLRVTPELSFSYIGFNTSKPPFDDANIRRAFSQAIDKDKLVSLVAKDMVKRADGILPPGMPGYNEALRGLDFNIDAARQLIAGSKYGDVSKLPPITITTYGYGTGISPDLEAIVYQWRQNLGVEVKVRKLEPDRFLYYLKEEKDEMFYTDWIADYPHPQDFLDILFRTGSDNNYGEYGNPEVDTLLDRAGVEQDRKQSLALYQQAEQKLVDDAACLPIDFGQNYILVKPYVKGYNVNPLGFVRLDQVWVEPH